MSVPKEPVVYRVLAVPYCISQFMYKKEFDIYWKIRIRIWCRKTLNLLVNIKVNNCQLSRMKVECSSNSFPLKLAKPLRCWKCHLLKHFALFSVYLSKFGWSLYITKQNIQNHMPKKIIDSVLIQGGRLNSSHPKARLESKLSARSTLRKAVDL